MVNNHVIDIKTIALELTYDIIELTHSQSFRYCNQVELDIAPEELHILIGQFLPSFYHVKDRALCFS